MKKKLSLVLALLIALSVFAAACGGKKDDAKKEEVKEEVKEEAKEEKEEPAKEEEKSEDAKEPAADGAMHIEVVSKGKQHQFWQAVEAGSKKAAEDNGATMKFEGPPSESDIQDQVNMLENAITAKPNAIALAALDVESVKASLENAKSQNIPIIGFDSGVPGAPEGSVFATASTNNNAAGALAAENLFPVIEEEVKAATADAKVRIAVLSQDVTSESIMGRTAGFVDKMKELVGENVAVVGVSNYADGDEATATVVIEVGVPAKVDGPEADAACQALLDKTDVIAIYGSNEFAAEAMIRVNGTLDKFGNRAEDKAKIWAVGFDAGINQKTAVKEGVFFGSVTQDPFQIGYKAVELAIKAAKGEAVEDVDTGAKWYNAENIDNEDIALLVYD